MEIYIVTNKINGKIYVGQSTKSDPTYFGSGVSINRAIAKYGKENFKKEVIELCTADKLNEREIYWISYYRSTEPHIGYNLTYGGDGGDTISLNPNREDIIKRISESNMDKKFTQTHKDNISFSKKGKSNGCEGRKYSDETIQKMSDAKNPSSGAAGTKRTPEQLKARREKYEKEGSPKGFKIIITDKDNNVKEFKSAREAARTYNCTPYKILNNKIKNLNIIIS